MPQYKDLDVLDSITAESEQQHTDGVARQAVQQRPHHRHPHCPTPTGARRETSRSTPNRDSGAPQGRLDSFDCLARPLVDTQQLAGRDILHQRSYLDFKLRLADHLLGDHGDRVALANSVEARYPYLDLGVIECARALSPDLALHRFQEKYVLKRLAESYLPAEIVHREKFAFHANTSPDLVRADRSWIDRYLSPDRIRREGYFNPETVWELRHRYADREFKLDLLYEDDVLMVVITFGIFLETFEMPHLS
jgi:asparagine synthase (glutamine-hydrolysing)